MQNDEIKYTLKTAIASVLQTQDLNTDEWTDGLCPIKDLGNFDSVAALEAILNIEAALNLPERTLPNELFWDNPKKEPLTIGEIAKLVADYSEKGGMK